MKIFNPAQLTVTLTALALVTACANKDVIVDSKGVDMSRYAQDRRECDALTTQVSTGTQAAKSAGVGAVVAGAVGAIFGNSGTVGRAAGAGGVVGGARGALQGESEKEQVLRNCLRGRGYRVLN